MADQSYEYSINSKDRFFPEAFHFVVSLTGSNALLAHLAAQTTIRNLVAVVNSAHDRITGSVSDHPISEPFWVADKECPEQADVYGLPDCANYLNSHGVSKPSEVRFVLRPFSGELPPPKEGEAEWKGRGTPIEEFLTSLCCYLIGGAYERSQADIKSRHGEDPSHWPVEIQFFRHLRNGCFHNNVFSIRPYQGKPQIDTSNPPMWHTYTMLSDTAMNGNIVVNGFFRLPHFLPLMHDLSKIIS